MSLVLLLLLLHIGTRYAAERAIPLSMRNENMYSFDYLAALNILAGRGCQLSILPDTPEGNKVREFIWLQRPELTRQDLSAYVQQPSARMVHINPRTYAPDADIPKADRPFTNVGYYTGRILDLYVAALLWKIFGIRWDVFFGFYLLVSTAAALGVFVIARKTAGYWAGVVALLLYIASPLENQWAVRSIRDITPLWFSIGALCALLCLPGLFRSRTLKLLSYGAAGFAASVGCGWRSDCLVIAPILIVILIVQDLTRHQKISALATNAIVFCCGLLLTFGLIHALGPGVKLDSGNGFHVAYYGSVSRSDLFGLENSSKIFFCDLNTRVEAFYYADANHLTNNGKPYYSPAYAAACRAMYLRAISFDAWHWVAGFPGFIYRAMRATEIADLPVNRDYFAPAPAWSRWVLPVRGLLLDSIAMVTPFLVILGIAAICFWTRFSVLPASMVCLLLTYSTILFTVLPVYKNSGMLVLPICILGAIGLTSIVNRSTYQPHWRIGTIVLLSIAIIWLGASAFAWFWSSRQRTDQILAIRKAVAHAQPDPAASLLPRSFRVRRPAGAQPDRAGYLLEIDAGAHPGSLSFRERREGDEVRLYESEHPIHPNRRQFFFFTAFQGALDHVREYRATVLVNGDARITSALRADLSDWKGLEVSTVFYDGERIAGSPSIGYPSNLTTFGPGNVDQDLLYLPDKLDDPPYHDLTVDFLKSAPFEVTEETNVEPFLCPMRLWSAAHVSSEIQSDRTLRFVTTGRVQQGWLVSPPLTSSYERDVYFQLKYRLRSGRLAVLILGPNNEVLAIGSQADALRRSNIWNEVARVHVRPNQPFRLAIVSEPRAPADANIVNMRLLTDSLNNTAAPR